MFEKEAEERAERKISNFIPQQWGVSLIRTERTYETVEGAPHFYLRSLATMWKEGAEVGYNKANEWHYVKDGDLPKDDIKLAIIEIDDCGYLLCNYRNGFWYDANSGATCAEWITNNIIAWKEIVLPEE